MGKQDIYKKNLGVLEKKFPHIFALLDEHKYEYSFSYKKILNERGEVNVIVDLPGSHDTLFYNDHEAGILNSAIETLSSPLLKKHDILMCIGMGLGYIPLAAARTYTDNPRIVIMERFPETFNLAISLVELTELFEYQFLDIYLGWNFSVSEVINSYSNDLYVGCCRRITHIPSRQIHGEKFLSFEREIDEDIKVMLTGWNTIRRYGNSIFENGIHNLTSLFNGITVDRLQDKFKEIPAVVVASGPSLQNNLKELKEIQNNALILSCDSAVKPLIEEGIVPNMVFSVDHMNADFSKIKFNLEELRQTILVYWMDANADSVRGFLGPWRVAVSSEDNFKNTWIRSEFGFDFKLPGFVSSNADMAILTAIHMGCDPIVLAGMDLAYSEGKDHVNTAVIKNKLELNNLLSIDGLRGYPVYTVQPMITGRNLLEKNIQLHNRNFINVSLNGAFIKGAQIKSLSEVKESLLTRCFDFSSSIAQIDWHTPFSPGNVNTAIMNIVHITRNLSNDARDSLISVCRLLKSYKMMKRREAVDKVKESLNSHNRFKVHYKIVLMMINSNRYENQLDVDRRIVNMEVGEDLTIDSLNKETLTIQKKYYQSVYMQARRIFRRLDEKNKYFQITGKLRNSLRSDAEKDKISLELARIHASEGVTWLSEQAYRSYLDSHPDDTAVLAELSDLYMDMGLWRQAHEVIRSAKDISRDDLKLTAIKEKFENQLSKLLESAKAKITDGDNPIDGISDATRLVFEYLSAFPEHPESLSLLEKMEAIENGQQQKIDDTIGFTYSPAQCARLEEQAACHVSAGEGELAVGIYEGLSERSAEKKFTFRMNIGDIRFVQGDYKSALWNYNKGLSLFTGNADLKARIRFVKPFVDAIPLQSKGEDFLMTIILPFLGAVDGIVDCLKNIDKTRYQPCEVLLLCKSGNEETLAPVIREATSLKSDLKILFSESDPLSAQSLNMALLNSNGTYIVMLNHAYESDHRCIDLLLRRLAKRPFTGLVRPFEYRQDGIKDLYGPGPDRHCFPVKKWDFVFLLLRRKALTKTGLLDEDFDSIFETLEDFKMRFCLEGFQNVAASYRDIRDPCGGYGHVKQPETISEKWAKSCIPEPYKTRYEIMQICENARFFYLRGNSGQAIEKLIEGISLYPNSNNFYRWIAQILIQDRRYKEAIETLNTVPEESQFASASSNCSGPAFYDLWDCQALYAHACLGTGDAEKAVILADAVLVEEPENALMLNLKGTTSLIAGDYKNAKKYFVSAIRFDSGSGLSWLNLSRLRSVQGAFAGALKTLQIGFWRSPENYDIANELYLMACQNGNYSKAIDLFKKSLDAAPESKCLHYLLIDLLIRSGQYDEAMMLIEKSIIKFGREEGILDAAASIREHLGPARPGGNDNGSYAAVAIDSDLEGLESFLYELKTITKYIDFLDNGNSPISKKIAAIFGASIIPGNLSDTRGMHYIWRFEHKDVLHWLHRMEGSTLSDSCLI